MRFSGDFAFSENLARCPRRDKRAVKIAMQQLSQATPIEDPFAEAYAFRRPFPPGS
jgi:hypothetical protein